MGPGTVPVLLASVLKLAPFGNTHLVPALGFGVMALSAVIKPSKKLATPRPGLGKYMFSLDYHSNVRLK
jgi:hypothetical protein